MPKIHTTMDVFKLLEKSNCRQCNEPTCLAFAAAVFKGQRRIEECPRLDSETAAAYGGSPERGPTMAQAAAEAIEHLQAEVAKVDLARVAPRLGGTYADGRLTLRILGKTFGVDDRGRFITDIHVHEWIAGPVLQYILAGKGCSVSGNWAPMRELAGGQDWYRLFSQRCEKPLKAVADRYTDLFADMVHLFNGRRAGQHFDADISVVLHPLPLVPLLVCYWKPEEGMASDLHLFFDDGGARNLDIGSLYTLGAGLTLMFEKIAQRHG